MMKKQQKQNLDLVTSMLLPTGCTFSEQQKNAIFAEGSVNVVAGPGSGKTTVLIAKFALLLKQSKNNNQGICLITHTNVAVDEIKRGLKKVGISEIEYPNFLGTIQEFFNYFFARKAFRLVNKEKIFRVLDDDEYNEKLNRVFEKNKPEWYIYNPPSISKANPILQVTEDYKVVVNTSVKPSYRHAYEKSIKDLFSWGILTNLQSLQLANWYIEKYMTLLKEAVSGRFDYVLLDEAQDTSQFQYDLLSKILSDTQINFQKFGDPYQALYTLFDGNNDAWVPSEEVDKPYLEIAETSRFGTNIAELVKNVCIEKYDSFQSMNINFSFSPHFIIYENETDLLVKYRELISSCEEDSESFLKSKKKDAILSVFHEDLSNLFDEYSKPSIKPIKNEGEIIKVYNFLINLIAKELDKTFKEIKELISIKPECRVKISMSIKEFRKNNYNIDFIINIMVEVLSILTESKIENFTIIDIKRQITYFKENYSSNHFLTEQKKESKFFIGTVHSVKGETHRSTLLVLDTIFKRRDFSNDNVEEYWIFDLLKEYFKGNYINHNTITDKNKRDETIKALKLAYVALSRPTHLTAIAIPADLISNKNDFINLLINAGWIQYNYKVEHLLEQQN